MFVGNRCPPRRRGRAPAERVYPSRPPAGTCHVPARLVPRGATRRSGPGTASWPGRGKTTRASAGRAGVGLGSHPIGMLSGANGGRAPRPGSGGRTKAPPGSVGSGNADLQNKQDHGGHGRPGPVSRVRWGNYTTRHRLTSRTHRWVNVRPANAQDGRVAAAHPAARLQQRWYDGRTPSRPGTVRCSHRLSAGHRRRRGRVRLMLTAGFDGAGLLPDRRNLLGETEDAGADLDRRLR